MQRDEFEVDTVATSEEAQARLAETFYHLIVLDIRLDEADQTNIEGMDLLQTLNSHLGEAVTILMLTGYGTKAQMREAFKDYRVADFLEKQTFDNVRFRQQIADIFANPEFIKLDLDIHWQNASDPEDVVIGMEIDGERVKADTPLQERIAAELDDLLCRLFCDADSLLAKPLIPGYSGARVLSVQPFYPNSGGGQTVVVKFGDFRKIDKEYRHFNEYVQPFVGGGRRTAIRCLRRTPKLGGLVYSFLGSASDQLEDFRSFYRQAEIDQIQQVLNHLFLDTCAGWYANPGQLRPHNLTEDYQTALNLTPERLARIVPRNLKLANHQDGLQFNALNGNRTFRNPVSALLGQRLVRPTYVCTTHGDLNEYNIMVDQAGRSWLIDFQHTGPGHILRDVVKLDSVVRFQLLAAEEATLAERLELEQRLCGIERFSQVQQLSSKLPTENGALAKAYAVAIHLRRLAQELTDRNPSDDFSEYHIAAMYQALKTAQYDTLQEVQREHALISASLLTERLGL